jgi:hypothetical protein
VTTLPKGFKKLASSPTLEGLKKHISAYYGGESKTLVTRDGTANQWDVFSSTVAGKACGTMAVETSRGFFFGRMEA